MIYPKPYSIYLRGTIGGDGGGSKEVSVARMVGEAPGPSGKPYLEGQGLGFKV